jgi:hypothetical protein
MVPTASSTYNECGLEVQGMLHSTLHHWLAASLTAALIPLAAYGVERPNLSGSWHCNTSKSTLQKAKLSDLTWVIDQKDEALHISEIAKLADGKEVKTDFDCTTDGKECSTTLDGQPAKISFYFNGAMLVELDYKGHNRENIVKKRLQLADDGKSMNVELIRVVGTDQPGTLVFEKQ